MLSISILLDSAEFCGVFSTASFSTIPHIIPFYSRQTGEKFVRKWETLAVDETDGKKSVE